MHPFILEFKREILTYQFPRLVFFLCPHIPLAFIGIYYECGIGPCYKFLFS